jgi:metal-responsive CopG/Arc/MetJ family transcriptional regulator
MKKKKEKDRYVPIHITLEPKLYSKLQEYVSSSGQRRSEVIRVAIRSFFKQDNFDKESKRPTKDSCNIRRN